MIVKETNYFESISTIIKIKALKKRKKGFGICYFFLYRTNPTIAIAMIMAIPTATMYVIRSDVVAKFEGALVAVGAGVVVAAVATVALVSA